MVPRPLSFLSNPPLATVQTPKPVAVAADPVLPVNPLKTNQVGDLFKMLPLCLTLFVSNDAPAQQPSCTRDKPQQPKCFSSGVISVAKPATATDAQQHGLQQPTTATRAVKATAPYIRACQQSSSGTSCTARKCVQGLGSRSCGKISFTHCKYIRLCRSAQYLF